MRHSIRDLGININATNHHVANQWQKNLEQYCQKSIGQYIDELYSSVLGHEQSRRDLKINLGALNLDIGFLPKNGWEACIEEKLREQLLPQLMALMPLATENEGAAAGLPDRKFSSEFFKDLFTLEKSTLFPSVQQSLMYGDKFKLKFQQWIKNNRTYRQWLTSQLSNEVFALSRWINILTESDQFEISRSFFTVPFSNKWIDDIHALKSKLGVSASVYWSAFFNLTAKDSKQDSEFINGFYDRLEKMVSSNRYLSKEREEMSSGDASSHIEDASFEAITQISSESNYLASPAVNVEALMSADDFKSFFTTGKLPGLFSKKIDVINSDQFVECCKQWIEHNDRGRKWFLSKLINSRFTFSLWLDRFSERLRCEISRSFFPDIVSDEWIAKVHSLGEKIGLPYDSYWTVYFGTLNKGSYFRGGLISDFYHQLLNSLLADKSTRDAHPTRLYGKPALAKETVDTLSSTSKKAKAGLNSPAILFASNFGGASDPSAVLEQKSLKTRYLTDYTNTIGSGEFKDLVELQETDIRDISANYPSQSLGDVGGSIESADAVVAEFSAGLSGIYQSDSAGIAVSSNFAISAAVDKGDCLLSAIASYTNLYSSTPFNSFLELSDGVVPYFVDYLLEVRVSISDSTIDSTNISIAEGTHYVVDLVGSREIDSLITAGYDRTKTLISPAKGFSHDNTNHLSFSSRTNKSLIDGPEKPLQPASGKSNDNLSSDSTLQTVQLSVSNSYLEPGTDTNGFFENVINESNISGDSRVDRREQNSEQQGLQTSDFSKSVNVPVDNFNSESDLNRATAIIQRDIAILRRRSTHKDLSVATKNTAVFAVNKSDAKFPGLSPYVDVKTSHSIGTTEEKTPGFRAYDNNESSIIGDGHEFSTGQELLVSEDKNREFDPDESRRKTREISPYSDDDHAPENKNFNDSSSTGTDFSDHAKSITKEENNRESIANLNDIRIRNILASIDNNKKNTLQVNMSAESDEARALASGNKNSNPLIPISSIENPLASDSSLENTISISDKYSSLQEDDVSYSAATAGITKKSDVLGKTTQSADLVIKQRFKNYYDKLKFPTVSNETPMRELETLAEDQVLVDNSGLVILAPYFGTIFKRLNWIDDGGVLLEVNKMRALLLSHYLCTGTCAPQNWQLSLNKVLCGLPLNSVYSPLHLSEQELDEANKLLCEIIGLWQGLGKVSIQGFREAFIRRSGVLTSANGNWRLTVERKTLDILMETLPWSISTVIYSWMDKPLMVEW